VRWSPDGSLISFIGYVDETPQVMAMSSTGGETWALTSVKGGVTRYEWSPDGKQIAFIASNPPTAEEERRKKEKSYVIPVDREQRLPRIWLQEIPGGAPRSLTLPTRPCSTFTGPEWKGSAYAASDDSGFNASYNSAVYAISTAGVNHGQSSGARHESHATIFAGRPSIAFVSSGGRAG